MKLGSDKPLVQLQKMKSSFYGKPLDGVLIELLRSPFLQALRSEITLYLIGDDISSGLSDTKSPNLQFYRTAPNQESNLYSCDVGHSAVNYRNMRKPNYSTYNSNSTHYRR